MIFNLNYIKNNQKLLNIIAFLMAFCSLSYEILIASRLSRIWGEGMFYYPTCLGIFILFMGLGSSRMYFKATKNKKFSIQRLINIEIALSIIGALSIAGINLTLKESLYSINMIAFVVGFAFAAIIGYLSGQELPLIFNLCAHLKMDQKQIRSIIFYDYLASFFASTLCTLIFFAKFGFFKTSILIALINLLIVVIIFIIAKLTNLPFSRINYTLLGSIIMIFIILTININNIENKIIKRTYLGERNAILLEKRYTPYQQVLLFAMKKNNKPIKESQETILNNPGQYYLFAVLNGTLQFFEPFDLRADPDHTFLFDPYIKLIPDIENALLLGGGDGLPARQAVTYRSLKKITVVDIDKEWVTFSKTNSFMTELNRNSFSDKRVTIHFDDAFKWIIHSKNKYGIIIVDFPSEPLTLAKIRTTSIQFYRDIKRILKENGVAIMHSNTLSSNLKLSIISKTAEKSGLYILYGYKKGGSTWSDVEQIVLFKSKKMRNSFYKKYHNIYLKSDENKSIRERFGHLEYYYLKSDNNWISFYDPLVSRLPFRKKIKLLME